MKNKKKILCSIMQGFRIPDTQTKMKERKVQAYIDKDVPLYTIQRLSEWYGPKPLLEREEIERCERSVFNPKRLTLAQAKEKYPEWYERVVVRKEKGKKRWSIKRDLYDWWLNALKTRRQEVKVGHRYFCLLALAMYAVKCGISEEEIRRDLDSLVEYMDTFTETDDNHFTKFDAEDAFCAYKDSYCTFLFIRRQFSMYLSHFCTSCVSFCS